jgi:hypothetical protein
VASKAAPAEDKSGDTLGNWRADRFERIAATWNVAAAYRHPRTAITLQTPGDFRLA